MPYCLIGKIVVWGGGISLLALLSHALIMAYDGIARRWRNRLLGSPTRKFLIESIGTGMGDVVGKVLDLIGLRRLNAWMQDTAMLVLIMPILTVLLPPAFLELGLRYAWNRWHTTAAPSTLA